MTLQSENRTEPPGFLQRGAPLYHSDAGRMARLEFESIDPFGRVECVDSTDSEATLRDALAVENVALREELSLLREQMREREAEHERQVGAARLEWERTMEAKVRQEREPILETAAKFSAERDRYFAEVEGEIVKLALAIAARILHREATMDPMLLRGVVRVALDQITGESSTLLRVPVKELATWQAMSSSESSTFPEVVADERLASGECVLETNLGTVELGIAAQLQEVERGFFDLIQRRPS